MFEKGGLKEEESNRGQVHNLLCSNWETERQGSLLLKQCAFVAGFSDQKAPVVCQL